MLNPDLNPHASPEGAEGSGAAGAGGSLSAAYTAATASGVKYLELGSPSIRSGYWSIHLVNSALLLRTSSTLRPRGLRASYMAGSPHISADMLCTTAVRGMRTASYCCTAGGMAGQWDCRARASWWASSNAARAPCPKMGCMACAESPSSTTRQLGLLHRGAGRRSMMGRSKMTSSGVASTAIFTSSNPYCSSSCSSLALQPATPIPPPVSSAARAALPRCRCCCCSAVSASSPGTGVLLPGTAAVLLPGTGVLLPGTAVLLGPPPGPLLVNAGASVRRRTCQYVVSLPASISIHVMSHSLPYGALLMNLFSLSSCTGTSEKAGLCSMAFQFMWPRNLGPGSPGMMQALRADLTPSAPTTSLARTSG
mmetsp:Transcript_3186/g.6980  ORF Transcript_3186/g.6980 Transcript_3186/m.6980 type:complete len:367 (-) Transcript_3186:36-1136(-)